MGTPDGMRSAPASAAVEITATMVARDGRRRKAKCTMQAVARAKPVRGTDKPRWLIRLLAGRVWRDPLPCEIIRKQE